MIRSRHFRATEILCHFPDPCVVGRHDDFAQRPGFLALLDDVLNQRLAGDERKRFAGKPRRSVTGGNDANRVHGC
jgi:hypothetical protein